MQQMAPDVNTSDRIERAMARLRAESQYGKTLRELAGSMGVDHTTVGRWIHGEREPTGKKLQSLLAWSERFQEAPKPTGMSAADARGMRYAAESMAATLATILREARQLEDANPEAYRDLLRQSAATPKAKTPKKAAQ